MKTAKDLHLLYKQETGLYVVTNLIGEGYEDPEYTKWLEENAVRMLNEKKGFTITKPGQTEAERQVEILNNATVGPWKP
jgi:hypothetical protein